MGIKSIILILHCLQSCLSYPIDDRQDNFNNAELSLKFLNNVPDRIPFIGSKYANHQGIPEMVPYANQFGFDYTDNTPTINTNHFGGGDRPFVRPPRPRPPPDDVEVFAPPEQPRPPRPFPPGRPIPNEPNYGPFWPTNGRPVTFPREGALREGHIEMLPVLIENDQFPVIPERIESNVQIVPESMRNEVGMLGKNDLPMATIMAEKPNPVVLTEERERSQLIPAATENEPVRVTPVLMQKVESPMMSEEERSKMMQFTENEQPMPQPMIVETEKSFVQPPKPPQMTSFNENGATIMVERESPKEPMLMVMEKEEPFMQPVQHPREIPFTEDEGPMGNERRDPSEFIHIPQRLPERFKRNDDLPKSNDLEATKSFSNLLEDKLFDRQSIADNEIMMKDDYVSNLEHNEKNEISPSNENTTTTSATSTSHNYDSMAEIIIDETPINVDSIPIASSQPLINESIDKISTTMSTLDSNKLEFNHDANEPSSNEDSSTTVQSSNTETDEKPVSLSNEDSSTTLHLSNNETDEKTTPSTSILDLIEHEIKTQAVLTEKPINNENNEDEIESTPHPVKISTTLSPITESQETTTADNSIMELAKIFELDEVPKNENSTNQATSNHTSENAPAINTAEDLADHSDDKKLPIVNDKHPIKSQNTNQPSLHDDVTKKPPTMDTEIHVYNHPCNPIESVEHQMAFPLESSPDKIFISIPDYYTPQSYMNYGEFDQLIKSLRGDVINAASGLQGLHNLHGLHSLSQLYPIRSLPMTVIKSQQYPIPAYYNHVRFISQN